MQDPRAVWAWTSGGLDAKGAYVSDVGQPYRVSAEGTDVD
jgi:hypothetical protein